MLAIPYSSFQVVSIQAQACTDDELSVGVTKEASPCSLLEKLPG